ncbi:MAG: hypothetical protein ACRD1L_04925, partial [Terriglobales bacterium]
MPVPPYRVGILGATSLRGKELAGALRERSFPALPPRLFAPSAGAEADTAPERGLVAFDDEPALLETFSPEALAHLDVLFLAGAPDEAGRAWAAAATPRGTRAAGALGPAPANATLIVDLTSTLESEPGATLAGLEPAPPSNRSRLVVVAHPAAQALALLLELLAAAGTLQLATATVFEPASERDLPGLQELEQQTLRLLAVQPLPQAVF